MRRPIQPPICVMTAVILGIDMMIASAQAPTQAVISLCSRRDVRKRLVAEIPTVCSDTIPSSMLPRTIGDRSPDPTQPE
jgi:hypothetical protein